LAKEDGTAATTVAAVEGQAVTAIPTAVAVDALAAAAAYARHAPETRRAYAADWAHFSD
jgi:hypothetical protein